MALRFGCTLQPSEHSFHGQFWYADQRVYFFPQTTWLPLPIFTELRESHSIFSLAVQNRIAFSRTLLPPNGIDVILGAVWRNSKNRISTDLDM